MPSGNRHSESKRKLFRAITTRISQHNQSLFLDKDDNKDLNTIPNNTQNRLQEHQEQPHLQQQETSYPHSLNDIQSFQNFKHPPVTQDTDSQNNFSYLESVKKAPIKKRQSSKRNIRDKETPQSTLKVRHNNTSSRNTLSTSINNNSDNQKNNISNTSINSPAVESITSVENLSSSKTDSLFIDNNTKDDIDEYDYKTFSTNHPLRLSKVKAFEQAEMTIKRIFSIKNFDNQDSICNLNESKNDESDLSDIIILIPGMSKEETKNMLNSTSSEPIITENTYPKYGWNNQTPHKPSGKILPTKVSERLHYMQSKLKPLSKQELVVNKLENSKLPSVFQNTKSFLKELDPQELEFWELMNTEYDTELRETEIAYRKFQNLSNTLVDKETLRQVYQSIKQAKKKGSHITSVESTFSGAIQKKIKEEFEKEDTFTLNTS